MQFSPQEPSIDLDNLLFYVYHSQLIAVSLTNWQRKLSNVIGCIEREIETAMYLKKPIWSDGASPAPENPSESEINEETDAATMVVEELVTSLNTQRLYRELTLSLRTGLRDARAEFSFLRIRGLRSLLKTLRSIAESDSIIRLFSHTQTISDLQRLNYS